MPSLIVFVLVGFAAQMVDGSLGMAYGVTSSTLLVATGIAPAMASASVHFAEVGTTLISGASHWRFGNVDWRTVLLLGCAWCHRRLRRRHRPLQSLHRGGTTLDVGHLARPRRIPPRPVCRQEAPGPTGTISASSPGSWRPWIVRRLRRCQRRRRMGTGRHSNHARLGPDRAAEGDRLRFRQ